MFPFLKDSPSSGNTVQPTSGSQDVASNPFLRDTGTLTQHQNPVSSPAATSPTVNPASTSTTPTSFGALGMDSKGNPYYGGGYHGYARRTFANVFDPATVLNQPGILQQAADALQSAKNTVVNTAVAAAKFLHIPGTQNWTGTPATPTTPVAQTQATAMASLAPQWTNLINRYTAWDKWGQQFYGISATQLGQSAAAMQVAGYDVNKDTGELSAKPNLGQEISMMVGVARRGVGQMFWSFLGLLQAGGWVVRNAAVVPATIVADLGENTPVAKGATHLIMDDLGLSKAPQWLQEFVTAETRTWAGGIGLVANIFNGKLPPLGEFKDVVQRDYAAGAMIYSYAFDSAVRKDYAQRYQAGQDSSLIKAETEIPWIEAVGGFVGDPLTWMAGVSVPVLGGVGEEGGVAAAKLARIAQYQDVLDAADNMELANSAGETVKGIGGVGGLAIRASMKSKMLLVQIFGPWEMKQIVPGFGELLDLGLGRQRITNNVNAALDMFPEVEETATKLAGTADKEQWPEVFGSMLDKGTASGKTVSDFPEIPNPSELRGDAFSNQIEESKANIQKWLDNLSDGDHEMIGEDGSREVVEVTSGINKKGVAYRNIGIRLYNDSGEVVDYISASPEHFLWHSGMKDGVRIWEQGSQPIEIEKVVASVATEEMRNALKDTFEPLMNKILDRSKYGISDLRSTDRAIENSKHAGVVLSQIFNASPHPFEILDAAQKLIVGTEEQKAWSFMKLLSDPAGKYILSPYGVNAAVTMSELGGDVSTLIKGQTAFNAYKVAEDAGRLGTLDSKIEQTALEFMKRYGDTPAEQIAQFTAAYVTKATSVSERMMPSVNDMKQAITEVAKAKAAGTLDKIDPLVQRAANMYESVPTWVKVTNDINEIGIKKIHNGFMSFFTKVWLGMFPTMQPIRNMWGNLAPILIDMGPSEAFDVLGKSLLSYTSSDINKALVMGDVTSIKWLLNGQVNEGATRAIGIGLEQVEASILKRTDWIGKTLNWGLTKSQEIEAVAASSISLKSIGDDVRTALKSGGVIPSFEDMKKAGMTDNACNLVQMIAIEQSGNAARTREKLLEILNKGYVDDITAIQPSENLYSYVNSQHRLPELQAIKDAGIEGNTAKVEELRKTFVNTHDEVMWKAAQKDYAQNMDVGISNAVDSEVRGSITLAQKARQDGELNASDEEMRLVSRLINSRQNTMDYAEKFKGQMSEVLTEANVAKGKPISSIANRLAHIYDDKTAAIAPLGPFRDYMVDLIHNKVYTADIADLPTLWRESMFRDMTMSDGVTPFSLANYFPEIVPASLTKSSFADKAWRAVFEVTGNGYSGALNNFIDDLFVPLTADGKMGEMRQIAAELGVDFDGEMAKIGIDGEILNLGQKMEYSRQMSNWYDGLCQASRGIGARVQTPWDAIQLMAHHFGLQAVGDAETGIQGANVDGVIMRIINAHAPEGLGSYPADSAGLRDFIAQNPDSIQITADAFAQHFGSTDKGVTATALASRAVEPTPIVADAIKNSKVTTDLFDKVPGETGQPIRLFHGTHKEFENYDINAPHVSDKGFYAEGHYFFPQPENSADYAQHAIEGVIPPGGNIRPAWVNLENPYIVWPDRSNQLDQFGTTPKEITAGLRKAGYDGVVVGKMGPEGKVVISEVVAFDDSQIYSAVNTDINAPVATKKMTPALLDDMSKGDAAKIKSQVSVVPPTYIEGDRMTLSQSLYENREGMVKDFNGYVDGIVSKIGKKTPIPALNEEQMAKLDDFLGTMQSRMNDLTPYIIEKANKTRDFILHNYQKTYGDVVASYLFMFPYWQSRTYMRFFERIAQDPYLASQYMNYRQYMQKIHASMPEWYKYNIPITFLPGSSAENPLFFNLESSINPLNAITGVDFDDPLKRVDWLSRTVDDLSKFGPTIFAPIQWAVAAELYAKGETDAGNRWMGRLIPQSQPIKAALTLAGQDINLGPFVKHNETDPFVNYFDNGLDPYEERRVGRHLAIMVQNNQITQAQADDAAATKTGPVWEQAIMNAIAERAPGQIAGSLLGIGFKPRTAGDMAVDSFYTAYYQLISSRSLLTADDYRSAWTTLAQKYPFMDTVLISKRAGYDRDTAYAYAVLGRIAPGQLTSSLTSVGLSKEVIDKFYTSKGDFASWDDNDYKQFMVAITTVAAVLDVPPTATRQEWDNARSAYTDMKTQVQAQYGQDIYDKINLWYEEPTQPLKDKYLRDFPEVSAATDYQNQLIIGNSLLSKYYGGIDTVSRYYTSLMYNQLRQQFGGDIDVYWNRYYQMQIEDAANGTKTAAAFYKKYPELKAYTAMKTKLQTAVDAQVAAIDSQLPDAPTPLIRGDAGTGIAETAFEKAVKNTPTMTWTDWQGVLSEPMQRLILDYFQNGTAIPYAVSQQLDYMAGDYGFTSGTTMLQAIGTSLQNQNSP
jgi:polyhydroxyalkanoate synthesis regulator phasin